MLISMNLKRMKYKILILFFILIFFVIYDYIPFFGGIWPNESYVILYHPPEDGIDRLNEWWYVHDLRRKFENEKLIGNITVYTEILPFMPNFYISRSVNQTSIFGIDFNSQPNLMRHVA